MSSRGAKILLFTVFLAILVSLVGLSSWASVRAGRLNTVSMVQAEGGLVHVGVGGEVLTADEDGHTLGVFQDQDGRPWHTRIVSSIFREPDGRYLVGEFATPEVSEFDADGHLLHRIPLPFVPMAWSQVATLGPDIWCSDTMGNQVALVDRKGHLIARRKVGYPHAANLVDSPEGPVVVFVSTLYGRLYALDAHLHPVEVPLVDQLNRLKSAGRGPWAIEAISYVWMDRNAGRALVSLARGAGGDMTFISVTADGKYRVLGDTDVVRPAPGLEPDDMMATAAVEIPPNRVLAPSPRASTVFSFIAPEDETTPFCHRCSLSELAPNAQPLAGVLPGITWPNGTLISDFGDAKLRAHYHAAAAKLAHYRALTGDARAPLFVLVALLLGGWLLSRVTASDDGHQLPARLQAMWTRLIDPALPTLLAALGMVVAAALGGALLGEVALGNGGALVAGGVVAWAASRLWITPWLVRHQSPAMARAAFDFYYGPGAPRQLTLRLGETVDQVSFALPERQGMEKLEGVASGALDSDLWDVVTSAIPRAVLLARTSERLLVVKCSAWGSPLANPALLEIASAAEAPAGLVVTRQGPAVAAFRLGGPAGPGESLVTAAPRYRCMECGQPAGGCIHRGLRLDRAILLSALFPGLGQLGQRRFGAGRLLMVLGAVALVGVAHVLIPQLNGAMPWDPTVLTGPLASLASIWGLSLGELWLDARLSERRAVVARGI